jgi:hypothetical protein
MDGWIGFWSQALFERSLEYTNIALSTSDVTVMTSASATATAALSDMLTLEDVVFVGNSSVTGKINDGSSVVMNPLPSPGQQPFLRGFVLHVHTCVACLLTCLLAGLSSPRSRLCC